MKHTKFYNPINVGSIFHQMFNMHYDLGNHTT